MILASIIAIILLVFEYINFGLATTVLTLLGCGVGLGIAFGCIILEEKLKTKINLKK